ncbi:putative bifunctional diguanylate cyclase/phosphodiesterase [Clostridium saccharobutylicum]|uniref:Signaling protein n=1 Tax=Clostridium saccharobutylicum DSM 13864 TaxID=1345695 RepID=U5MZ99_CLOSA|nr:bifunctional diguanylate cyclase/phosphodiesterase [Clostridium saccharobutylicum]AGX44976.1 signaling protein [Clostridium saccharobutylicum DSM 13864]AQR92258.1 phytochrome-like protein cph2 [Clostridium saccharobutylicum]AQS02160.1 phytochrome-like protein cph2 [Clostridium saccharobutylicum]AQS11764.1 phytochrome-like protein cph2 [Clostridium saccharobutylicum]AQS16143.1 phytochrome-like protein cph2 [Clostridium saccharobutylicum]
MNRAEFKLNHEEVIHSSYINGITMMWNPLESQLMIEDKILDVLKDYDVKNQSVNKFIKFVHSDDKRNMMNFFSMNLESIYKKKEELHQRYRLKINKDLVELIFIGKVIKNDFKYYLIGTNYLLKDIDNNCNTIKSLDHRLDLNTDLDKITGLPSSYSFKNSVSKFLKDAFYKNIRTTMFVVDLDNFKFVNDSYNHDFGDLLLNEVAKSIIALDIKDLIISRYSGNTFLLFKPNIISIDDVVQLSNKLIKCFNMPNIVNGREIYLTASIGVALSPDHGIDYNTLLKNADAAMYKAKKNGKNEFNLFDDSISVEFRRTYSLQKGLRTALENNEFYVVFQPKVSLDNSLVNGFEALARWNSKEFGLVSPGEFIPIAESSKMIIPIGNFVLEEVFKKTKCLLNEGNDNFKIAVNLSEMQLREDIVLSEFKRLIKKYNISPRYIEVEITESMLMKSFDKNVKILKDIKDLGISIALDDFGTGYSSLNYLTKLPIDVLKIDRSFVIDLVSNPKSKCIVENIINLSHQLGIKVVAEGVEDGFQVEYLKTILCDIVQGYYFSKPRMFNDIVNIVGKEI